MLATTGAPRCRFRPLAGGDKHHVGTAQQLFDLVLGVLGGLTADLRIGAGAQPAGGVAADVEFDVGIAHQQRLGVGVDRDEFHAFEALLDHSVDGVDTATTDTHDLDDGQVVVRGVIVRLPPWWGSVLRCVCWQTLNLNHRLRVMSSSCS